jgi:CheY-like chemotaxis protein/HPt (histidine-containing phosphotransfer) domain-containing protein
MQPVVAPDARSAVALVDQAGRADQPFDLCLIDARMPGINGFQLAEDLLARSGMPGGRMLMLLTSGDGSGDVARCERLGIAAYLMKPINQSELFDTLVAVVCGEDLIESPTSIEVMELAPRARGLQILLTEDSLYNQKLAMAVLAKRGHRVTVANNGREALACLRRGRFDLILMDVQMPEMDGLEATRCIRARERDLGEHIPIIAMTAQALTGDREKCLAAGMDDYLSKPVRAAELHAAIDRLLGTGSSSSGILRRPVHELRGDSSTNGSVVVDLAAEPVPDESNNSQSVLSGIWSRPGVPVRSPAEAETPAEPIDWKVPLASVGDDPELLRDVLDAFLEETTLRFHEMESALVDTNPELLRRAAHTLKGGLTMLGAMTAAEQAGAIEKLGVARRTDTAAELMVPLRRSVDRLIPQIEAYINGRAKPHPEAAASSGL